MAKADDLSERNAIDRGVREAELQLGPLDMEAFMIR